MDEAAQHIYDFITSVDRNSVTKVKRIYTDIAKEFIAIRRTLGLQDTTYTTSLADSP